MTNIHWFPGHMAKAIREIDEKIKLIDLVIEIVDCRISFSSSNPVIKKLINNKARLVVLNKKDLADPVISEEWIKYFESNNIPVILLDSKHNNISKKIINKIYDILNPKIIKNLNRGIKNSKLKVLVIGIPNVGKSTFINALINKNSAKVGNQPGITKGQQWFKLNNNIDLLDTPGILWPKIENPNSALNLSFVNTIKSNLLPKEEVFYKAFKWMYKNYFSLLAKQYFLNEQKSIDLDNPIIIYKLLLQMQENKFYKFDEDNLDLIMNNFLNKLWNNEFGLVSFERPKDIK